MDIGSNSVHLLVARLGKGAIEQLHDESELLGLGDVVDRHGSLPDDIRRSVVDVLVRYRDIALAQGAQSVTFVGTEPIRRASNASALADEVVRETGLALHVASSRVEAELTYLGVTAGFPPSEPLVVVDIGGGSTEVIVANAGRQPAVHTLPSGSARLGAGIIHNDPPTASELDRLRLGAMQLVNELPSADPRNGVFVGGTATNLVRLVPLSRPGLEHAHGLLTSLSASQLVKRYGVNARRARQLPAGLAIVEALLEHYGLAAVTASDTSLRDGAILAASVLGEDWPQSLSELLA